MYLTDSILSVLPEGLRTLLLKKKNFSLEEFLFILDNFLSEKEKKTFFEKIKKETGFDLTKVDKDDLSKNISLFKSVPISSKKNSSENKVLVLNEENKDFFKESVKKEEKTSSKENEVGIKKEKILRKSDTKYGFNLDFEKDIF